MRIFKLIVTVFFFTIAFQYGWSQKNITKPNVQGANGVSVNTYTGGLFYQRQDLFIPGRGLSLDLTFTYNTVSRDKDWGFGRGWTFNYNMAYVVDTTDIVIEHMDGSRNRYLPNGSGGWYCPRGVFDSLTQYQPNQFLLRSKDGMQYFFDDASHKKLTKIEDRNGNTIMLTYSDTLLTTLTDPSGRMVHFTWQNGKLQKITDPNTTPAREILFEYDDQGNPITVTDPLNNFTQYEYDDQYKLTAVVNKNGYPVNIEYNYLDAATAIISCVGKKTITYNYENLKSYFVEKVNGENQITTYHFNETGQLIQQTGNCCGYNVQYEYDEDNNITKRIDANGNATSFVYDDFGNVLQEVDPLGNAMTYIYEPTFNLVASETDRNGNTASYTYDGNGNLTQISRPLGITESFTYDGNGNLLTSVDGRNNSTAHTYDIDGNLTSIIDAENGNSNLTYDGVGNNITISNQNNQLTSIEYDLMNRQIKVTNALNHFFEFTYDAVGNKTSYKDGNGNLTEFTYDGVNRLVATLDALGNVFIYQYDERENVVALVAENGDKTQFDYNELNRLAQKINPVGDITAYEYDGVGNLIGVSLPGGNIVSMSYDVINRVTSISDNLGPVSTYTYDKNSNRLTVKDGNDNITSYKYDDLDRIIKMIDPKGKVIQYNYDGNFNLTQVIDRKNNTSFFTYDKLNRRITNTDPLNNSTTYAYDPVGNLLSLTDAKSQTTTYVYDAINRLINEIYDNGDLRTFTFSPANNLISRSEPNGYTINYNYDVANRLTSRIYPGGNRDTFSYDAKGRILTATNQNAVVSLNYDEADRLLSETSNGLTTSYSYNSINLTRQINYPGGKQIVQTYDQRGRLNRINDNSILTTPLASFEYDVGNRLLKKILANGTISELTYDPNSNVTKIEHLLNNIHGFEYDYDDNDNKINEKNIGVATNSNQFDYDVFNRLTQFKRGTLSGTTIPAPTENIIYNYDEVHNRTSIVNNANTTNYTSNVLNQYTGFSGAISASLNYDNNGNLTNDGTHIYGYDYENRLVDIDGGTTGKYTYDAFGRRILKVVGIDSTFFQYAELNVIEERGNNGILEAIFVHGTGEDDIIATESGGNKYFYYHNALGSITHLANANGDLVEQYTYDAYGKVTFFDGGGVAINASAFDNSYLFTGQRYDEESGLYFYKSRYYSGDIGRFLQRDPLGYIDGPSLYEYVFSNPVNFVDPFGLNGSPCDQPDWEKPWWEDCAVGAGLGAAGGAVGGLIGAAAGAVIGCAINSYTGSNPLDRFRKGEYAEGIAETLLDVLPIPAGKLGGKLGSKLGSKVDDIFRGGSKKINSVNDLLDNLGDLKSLKKGAKQGKYKGDADKIFDSITKGGETLPSGAVRLKDGTIINKHISHSTGVPTISVNKGGKVIKIRIE